MRVAYCLVIAALAGAALTEDFNSTAWRDEIAKGYLPYRKLTMEDFPVGSRSGPRYLMNTECFMHYAIKAKWREQRGEATAEVTDIQVRSGFDRNKSWRKPGVGDLPDMLNHEQGHLDINELHAAQFRSTTMPIGKGSTGKAALEDLKAKVQAMCEKVTKEAQTEQDLYDKETNHGMDTIRQGEWSRSLSHRLENGKIVYWDKAG